MGEALVSFLDEKGRPNIVEQALIRPPFSQIGPITSEERTSIIGSSLLNGVYEHLEDWESAYELLKKRAEQTAKTAPPPAKRPTGRRKDTALEAMTKSAARSVGRQIATELVRGILGSFLGGKSRRR